MSMPSTLRLKQGAEQNQNLPSSLRPKQKQEMPQEQIQEGENDLERDVERNIARMTSRGIETVAGAPGDLTSFIGSLMGKEQNVLPTSQKLKEISEKASLGYTKPQSELEERGDEFISDLASMAIPGAKGYSLVRNIGIPVIGNLVKEGVKYANGDEKSQAYGKIGTMVALDLATGNKGGIKSYINSLYSQAEKSIPKGLSIDASKLSKSLDSLEKNLSAGGSRITTEKSLEKISEIKKEIKKGKIDVNRLAAYRPSINEAIDELGGFNFEIPKKLKPKVIHNLNEVKGEVIKTLDQYGEKFNPEFLKYNRAANEAYAAMSRSNVIANFFKDKIPYSPKSKAVQTLFHMAPAGALYGMSKLTPLGAAGAAAGYGGYQAFKVLHRIKNSPTLAKYYGNVLKEAASGNVPSTIKNLEALDLLLEKEEK